MDWWHLALAAGSSWLLKLVYECRFHCLVGLMDRRTCRRVAPYMLAALVLRSVFIVGVLLWLGAFAWAAGYEYLLIAGAAAWYLIERLLRVAFEGALMQCGFAGHAAAIAAENLLGLDSSQWVQVRRLLLKQLLEETAARRRIYGRQTTQLIAQHRKRIDRHLSVQRSLAWVIGGEWYQHVHRRNLDNEDLHMDPLYFEIVVNAVGLSRLPIEDRTEEREFGRKLVTGHKRVYVLPRPDAPNSRESARVIDSSLRGLRLRVTPAIEALADGDTILIQSDRTWFECERRWQRNGEAGFRVVREVAAPPEPVVEAGASD